MKRAIPSKPDYLSSETAARKQKLSLVFALVMQVVLFLAIAFGVYVWLVNSQFKLAMYQQADALGQSLLTQTAVRATELMTLDDKLGINIVLGDVAKNPLVSEVVINDLNNKELYRAGLRQVVDSTYGKVCAPIVIQQEKKATLCIRLNTQQFELPWMTSIERSIIVAGVLLLIGLIISFRLGRRICVPIVLLREWLRDPVMPTPAIERKDEIGDLARDLQAKLIDPEVVEAYYAQFEPEPELEQSIVLEEQVSVSPETSLRSDALADSSFDQAFLSEIRALDAQSSENTTSENFLQVDDLQVPIISDVVETSISPLNVTTAVLFIQLGGQHKLRSLPKERLINLLQRYRDCLDQAVHLYHGEIHTLGDGSSLILFHSRGAQIEHYLANAICCGELMRALSHELQIELADTDIAMLLQIALTQGEVLLGLTPSELFENEIVQAAKTLAENSRNLLLLDQTIVLDDKIKPIARVRALANPADAYCVERVIDPYAETLEKQLRTMRNNSL